MNHESINSYKLSNSVNKPVSLIAFGALAFIVGLDASMAQIAIYRIGGYYNLNHTQALWIIDIYGVALGGSLLIFGKLCDKIGPKTVFVLGITALACASITAVFAVDWLVLVVARALAGLSAAAVTTSAVCSLRKFLKPKKNLATGVAAWMVGISLGTAIAPAVGGILIMTSLWQTIFLFPGTLIVFMGVLCWNIFPSDGTPSTRIHFWKHILIAAGIVSSFVLVKAPSELRLQVAPGLIAFVLLASYVLIVEAKSYLSRMMKAGTNQIICLVALLISMAGISGVWYVCIKYLQFGLGLEASSTGLLMVIPAACQVIVSMLLTAASTYQFRVGATVIGGAFAVAALVFTSLCDTSTLLDVILVCSVVNVGLTPLAVYAAESVITPCKAEQAGTFVAASESSSEIGFAYGIAVVGTIANMREGELLASQALSPEACKWYSLSSVVSDRESVCEAVYHSIMSEIMLITSGLIIASCCITFKAIRR